MTTPIVDRLERPFRPVSFRSGETGECGIGFFDLPKLADGLRREPEYAASGVSALTLQRDEHATLVLVALRRGAVMREHRAPSAGALVVLSGRVAFLADREPARTDLVPGALAVFAAGVPHAVEALDDAVYLVTIGGRERSRSPS